MEMIFLKYTFIKCLSFGPYTVFCILKLKIIFN